MKDGKNVTKALMYKAKAYDQVYDTDLEQLLLKPNGYQSRTRLYGKLMDINCF